MRDHGTFLGKTFDVLCFFFQETHGNKQRKVSILMTSVLEHLVEDALHIFPNRIAPWLDDHAASHG